MADQSEVDSGCMLDCSTPARVFGPVDARESFVAAPPALLLVVYLPARFLSSLRAAGRGRLPDCIPDPIRVARSAVFTRRSLLASCLALLLVIFEVYYS